MWILVVICIALLSTAEKAATKDEDPKGRTLYFSYFIFSLTRKVWLRPGIRGGCSIIHGRGGKDSNFLM